MNSRYIKRMTAWGLSGMLAVSTLTIPTVATIEDEKNALWELEKEKQEVIDIINNLETEKASLEENVRVLDGKLSEISEKLYETEKKLSKVQKKIKKNKKKLKAANKSIKEQYASMKLRIQFMYENGNQQMFDLFFSSENIADFLNKAEYISELSSYDRNMLDKMKETRQTIIDTKAKLEKQEASLIELQAEQTQEKSDVESLVTAKQQELEQYVSNIEDKEHLMEELEGQIGSQQEVIYEMESIEARRAAEQESREQESREAVSRAVEEQGDKYIEPPTQSAVTPSGNYIWPLPGYYSISSDYGYRSDPFTGATKYHSGIDIPAPSGTSIVAAASGVVAWSNYSTTAGNWIGIDHGNGVYTVYMHMSARIAQAGQTVSQGQTIGLVGTTGSSTGNHLHFSVRLNGSYVSPWNYVGN